MSDGASKLALVIGAYLAAFVAALLTLALLKRVLSPDVALCVTALALLPVSIALAVWAVRR